MAAISEKAGANQQVAKGSTIIEQGSFAKTLVILNQGKALYRKTGEDQQAKPVFMVQGPVVLGCDSLLTSSEYSYEVVASTDAVVSCYATSKENLQKIFASKPNIGLLVLRSTYKECAEAFNKLALLNSFIAQLVQANDTIGLGYSLIAKDKFKDDVDEKANLGGIDPVLPQARVIVENFIEKGGTIPEPLTEQFMLSDHSSFLDREYNPPDPVDRDDLAYFKRFVSLPPQIQAAVAQKDPAFFYLTGQRISNMSSALFLEIESAFFKLDEMIQGITEGDYSWLSKTTIEIELMQQNISTASEKDLFYFSKYLAEVLQMLQQKYSKKLGLPLPSDIRPALQKLLEFTAKEPAADVLEATVSDADEGADAGQNFASIKDEVSNSAKKIFQWAGMSNEELAEYSKLMSALKAMKNPLDHEGDARKTRRALNTMFWKVYEKAALKYFQEKPPLPRIIEMFFNFAFLEETILEEEQILAIYNGIDTTKSRYPIHTTIEWLQLIYENKVPTSVNELGLTFFELLKQENRDAGWKRESDLPPSVNSPEARLKFEIANMLQTNVKLTSGSILNHFSILSKYQITQNMQRAMVSKEALSAEIDTLLNIDFSAFHREVLFEPPKDSAIKREFVQLQIIPNIIIVPSAGPVFQFWQDREGKAKQSPGRIIAPSLAMADMYTMLLSAVGALRWETVKTIMGVDWNNIANSSLTADYIDDVQFFKKNRELSPEVKEQLSAEFKRFRDDRARFVHDYITWVKFESDGTQRFNKVARKIFSKHIPFSKDLREKLLKLPSYTDVVQKSINIRKRKASELEPRYRNYRQDNDGILPEELENTYKFYNMEY